MDPQDPTAPQNVTPAPAPNQPDQLTYNDIAPLINAKGWLKFLGILNIIMGIITCLTCIGLLFGWLPIWMGVLLYRASKNLNNVSGMQPSVEVQEASRRLGTYFTILGIVTLIGMIFQIIYMGIMLLALIGGGFAAMHQGSPY